MFIKEKRKSLTVYILLCKCIYFLKIWKKNTVNGRGGGAFREGRSGYSKHNFFYFISPDQVTDIQN